MTRQRRPIRLGRVFTHRRALQHTTSHTSHFQEFVSFDVKNYTLDLSDQVYDQCWFTVTCNDNPTNIILTGTNGIVANCVVYDLTSQPLEQLHAMHAINPNPQAWNLP